MNRHLLVVLFGLLLPPLHVEAQFSKKRLPAAPQYGSDTVEERLEKLVPRTLPEEIDLDRLYAAAQYAHGRLLLQRDDAAGALRRFERAYRYDPRGVSIAREVVAVAGKLNRHSEAARYAILAAEKEADDPKLLRQLGEILVEQGELERAAPLWEKAIELLAKADAPDPSIVLLRAELGRVYLALQRFGPAAESLAVLRAALDNPEKFGFSRLAGTKLLAERPRLEPMIAESLFRVGKLDEAALVFRRANEAKPDAPLLAYHLARIAAERNDWKAAREQLDKYFTTKSTSAGAQPYELLRRSIVATQGEAQAPAELLTQLTALHEQDSSNVPLRYYLADKLFQAGKLDVAQQYYEKLLESEPLPVAFRALARIYLQRRDVPHFLQMLERAAVREGGLRPTLGDTAELVARDKEFFDQLVAAVTAPEAAGAASQIGYARYLGLSLLAVSSKRWEVVEDLYRRALSRPDAPKEKIHESVGMALLIAGENHVASKVFAQALSEQPAKEKAAAYAFYLAGTQENAGDTDAALATAEKCAELLPESAQFQARPAWVLYHAKRLPAAEERYRALLAKFDEQHQSGEVRDQMRQARFALSNICAMREKWAEAEEWLEQVLDEFPEDVGAHNDLGYLWAEQGKHLHRALAMCQRAATANPDSGAYLDSLGWVYFKLGQFPDAIRELEKAAELMPDGVILDHLGDAYLGAEKVEQAIGAWQRASEAFQKEKEPEKLRQTQAKIEKNRK